MRCAIPALAALCALAAMAPAGAQDGRDEVPEVGQDVERREAPVIIDRTRGPTRGEDDEQVLHSELESFVQIQGSWAVDPATCKTVNENGGNGLYLTDTLIRWEEATCSIRNVDVANGRATVLALCATEGERRERTFDLARTGEERLSLSFTAEGGRQEVTLTRCAAP